MSVPATVHHHGDQVVQPLRVGGVSRGVEEAELQGEDDAIGQLGVALQLLHVLEALQVQRQDHRQLLDAHPAKPDARVRRRAGSGGQKKGPLLPLVRLLLASTFFTVVFVFAAQCFCVAEPSEDA